MSKNNRRGWQTLTTPLLALMFFGLAGCAAEPPRPTTLARGDYQYARDTLDGFVRKQMKEHGVVGLSVAVLDDQRVVWAEGFGYADKAAKTTATAHTRYRAGSISKVLTTAAAMQLAEAGKLDIDAPLVKALPEFSIRSRDADAVPITPRMIMTHHAGLPSDRLEGMWTEHPAHFTSVVEALHDEYRTFPPNFVHAYSNTGFSVLGAAIQQVSGMPYENFMRDRLLTPLGMTASAFETATPSGTQAYDEKGKPGRELALRDTPAGGLNTTAPDLLQFARMWFAGGKINGAPVLSAASIAEMQRRQNTASLLDADRQVGLGWHFSPASVRGGGPVLIHGGSTLHHQAVLMLLPEHKLAVAVMANTTSAHEPMMKIGDKALGLFLEAKSGIAQPEKTSSPSHGDRYPAAPPQAFPGYYSTVSGFMAIQDAGGRLRVEVGGERLSLKRRESGYLGLEYRLLGLFPIDLGKLGQVAFTRTRIAGREVLLAGDAGGFSLVGEKIEPRPIPAAWSARLGNYEYAGNDARIAAEITGGRLVTKNGFLLAEIKGKGGTGQGALDPIGDDEAILRGLGRGLGETVHVRRTSDGETLHFSGLAFKRKPAAENSRD